MRQGTLPLRPKTESERAAGAKGYILGAQLVDGGLVPAYVREAVRRAEEERPGASHIELPEDVAHQQVTSIWLGHNEGFLYVYITRACCSERWSGAQWGRMPCNAAKHLAHVPYYHPSVMPAKSRRALCLHCGA